MSDARPHVLVVDDEEDFCELMTLRLEHHGFRVTARHTLDGALDVIGQERVDSLVLDLRLENEDGMLLFDEVKRRGLDLPMLILTADGSTGAHVERLQGTDVLMPKPFDALELVRWLEGAVRPSAASRPDRSARK